MRAEGVSEPAIATFSELYGRLVAGDTGLVPEAEIEPVERLPDADELEPVEDVRAILDQAIVLRLNGGLGTSMGLAGPKSLLEVRDGLTFLDIVARQVLALRERTGARLPLVLMNSFSTREPSLERLARYPQLAADVPLDFVQHKEPKLRADDLRPVSWPADPALEWAPPGHGDLYPALVSSGMLDALLERGYRWAFVANVDNLGATLDPRILAWIAREEIPFLMEVADRTPADRKGGHLARRRADGGLVLREIAQTPEADLDAFQDVERHRYFNTNNLWLDLRALAAELRRRDGILPLPMIVNRKTVDPRDPESPAVIQLETAMGAAIGVVPGAAALRVPRRRFAPVKTTNDLLALRSDAYAVSDAFEVGLAPGRSGPPVIDLDDRYYKRLADFEARFADGAPSLVGCDELTVEGDVAFGARVVVRGRVRVAQEGPQARRIPDGAVLEG
ncbi:MAG: UTP--glucose-1-phosphate uridylyltransferase [Solirubrobacteraceae bacterium]|nr:UTP--glucose-1-phosphate uridylyltransferase [Solirubrobacteraceae bacterium]